MKLKHIASLLASAFIATANAQYTASIDNPFPAAGTPATPKVEATWNHYRNLAQIEQLCKDIAKAYPNLAKTYSIGKSYQGNEMWAMTISDFSTGDPDKKPGMIIFANIHSNEIQATTMALYTAWYLTEMHGSNEYIKELLRDKTFYIVPTINPDAREYFMTAANTGSSPRAGMLPVDSDRDGYIDEDGFNDLDGDGHITQMRRKNPNGRYIPSPNDPRQMILAPASQRGEYEILGYEGFDQDGDGRVNEDGVGGYDPNRDFGYGWEPNFIQRGTLKYPLSVIENRNLIDFVNKHPNIAAAQTYHNTGGMILSPSGAVEDAGSVNRNDRRVYDYIASKGEEIIPGYRSMIVYKDLYTTVGSDIDYFGLGLGMITYCNELLSSFDLFNGKYKGESADMRSEFDRLLLFNDGFVDWKEYDHPVYGKIEIGGNKKTFGRIHPGFLLESSAHRNMAFTLWHGYNTPKLSIENVQERSLGGGLTEITATINNSRIIPTHLDWDLRNKIMRPDWIFIDGAEVVSGMVMKSTQELGREQLHNAHKLIVDNIPGNGYVTVRWIVEGSPKYSIRVDSQRGGEVIYKK